MAEPRIKVAALALSASALVGIAVHEGYTDRAIQPVPGDKWTYGFGTTDGVKQGDKTTPERALIHLLGDADKFASAVRGCANVPMYQYEFDAYVSLTYNIGSHNFCGSTLVKKLHESDYEGACKEILRWDRFKGKPLPGLAKRRQLEYRQCMGN